METVKKYLKRYFIDAMSAMALGLFASLLIGTIFGTVGKYTGLEFFNEINSYASAASGIAGEERSIMPEKSERAICFPSIYHA